MRIIGITGGVGAGKSELLHYIETHYKARILLADQVANDLKLPGAICYEPLVAILGKDVLCEDGTIDKAKMAQIIFHDEGKLALVNALIHPAVKRYILEEIEKEAAKREVEYFFIEAALLIEEHYEAIVEELWYIYADEAVRAERLRKSRQYSEDRIKSIMAGQLPEQEFRNRCQFVIDNSTTLEEAYLQIDHKMED